MIPAQRGKGGKLKPSDEGATPAERHTSMTWAQRLKRVFQIDITTCRECGGALRIMPKTLAALAGQALACCEDPAVIQEILTHLDKQEPQRGTGRLRKAGLRPPVCSADAIKCPSFNPKGCYPQGTACGGWPPGRDGP